MLSVYLHGLEKSFIPCMYALLWLPRFTHWGWVTHICIGKQTGIGSDNGLSHGWCQAIIWTNAGILLIGPIGTNFSEILIRIQTFSFKKMHLKMSSAKWHPFCLSLNVLLRPDAFWCQWTESILVKALSWYLCCTKPLSEPTLTYGQLNP